MGTSESRVADDRYPVGTPALGAALRFWSNVPAIATANSTTVSALIYRVNKSSGRARTRPAAAWDMLNSWLDPPL